MKALILIGIMYGFFILISIYDAIWRKRNPPQNPIKPKKIKYKGGDIDKARKALDKLYKDTYGSVRKKRR